MAIKIFDLFHVYNQKTDIENVALKGVSLDLGDRFFAALVGKTGSGKSTLAQHLNYLLKPNSGSIEIEDFKISSNKKEMKKFKPLNLRKKVGYLFQFSENQLFSETVLKEVSFGPKNFGIKEQELKDVAIEALKKVGIDESFYERSPIELSGGEKRRIAIASVLASKPNILILDEPTAGLDAEGKENLISLLKTLYNEGISIILITHDMDVVYSCCETVIEMKDGNIVSNKETYEFFNEKKNDSTYVIPEIFKFCSVFEKESIKKCRNMNELLEA
jgi:energy-coupling factor transport system ATP-binding protein